MQPRTAARITLPSFFLAALALPSPALPCPVCNTGTGSQVRAGIADQDLARNTLAVVAPFAVTGGVAAAIHFTGRRGGNRRGT